MKMELTGVPKRQHMKFRHRRIAQKEEYNTQNTTKARNKEIQCAFARCTQHAPQVFAAFNSSRFAFSNSELARYGIYRTYSVNGLKL
jgi:hypothetical protein